jgi:hypothetical protein
VYASKECDSVCSFILFVAIGSQLLGRSKMAAQTGYLLLFFLREKRNAMRRKCKYCLVSRSTLSRHQRNLRTPGRTE